MPYSYFIGWEQTPVTMIRQDVDSFNVSAVNANILQKNVKCRDIVGYNLSIVGRFSSWWERELS